MSRRRDHRRLLALSACVIATVSACSGGKSDRGEPADPAPPREFEATFDVESPIELVAGDGQAWILTGVDGGASLIRIDHTGRTTDVVSLPGHSHRMAPYLDGVVVVHMDCTSGEEPVARVLLVDGGGATVAEEEYAREQGSFDCGDSAWDSVGLIGIYDDVLWMSFPGKELLGYDLGSGRTTTRGELPSGVACVLTDGLYTVMPLDEPYPRANFSDEPYDSAVHRLVDGSWTPLPDTRRVFRGYPLVRPECVGGALRIGPADAPAPAWSPAAGWVDREAYLEPPNVAVPPEAIALGQGGQLFALESDGVIRRVFAGPDESMSVEMVDVPADIFFQHDGPVPLLLFDKSSTVNAGCVQQPEARSTAQCYISSA
jgi:hypothetical protein